MAEAAVKPKPADTAAQDAERELTDGFHLVIDALKLNGINTIYGVPGIPITDLGRMAQAAGMRVISFRHEQNAGNAAAIAGFLTKRPGICVTVSAPGFLNGLTALANATTNCFPMILISGRLALLRISSARLTAAGAGIWAGAGSMTLTSELAPASASMTCEKSLAGRSR